MHFVSHCKIIITLQVSLICFNSEEKRENFHSAKLNFFGHRCASRHIYVCVRPCQTFYFWKWFYFAKSTPIVRLKTSIRMCADASKRIEFFGFSPFWKRFMRGNFIHCNHLSVNDASYVFQNALLMLLCSHFENLHFAAYYYRHGYDV